MKSDFDFLNSEFWIKYTHHRYLPLRDILYRLKSLRIPKEQCSQIQSKIQLFRKKGCIPLFLKTINKKFWYFPSDSLMAKISHIEYTGQNLFKIIETQKFFKTSFIKDAKMEEAVTSAIYEGANSTRSKAKALILSNKKPKNTDEWMLLNKYKTMLWIKKNSHTPLSLDVILKIHELITKNTLPGSEASFSGQFRDQKVYVGEHEGIPHIKIPSCLTEVKNLIQKHTRFLPDLIKGILLHYFVAYIHPFFDGNGRTARTLFYFESMKNNLKFMECLSISADLKTRGKRYENSFQLVKEHEGDTTYFIDFCLDSLLTAIQKVQQKVDYLISISHKTRAFELSTDQVFLLQKMALYKNQFVTIEGYAKSIHKSREIARRELKHLLKHQFLKEQKQGKKYIYSLQPRVLKSRLKTI